MSDIHVLPVNDIEPHYENDECPCGPRIEVQPGGGRVIVHNAYDGRELWETEKASIKQ